MVTWTVERSRKDPAVKDPILLVGLPGIGNVGKLVVDFLIGACGAKRVASFFSSSLPHVVFINESSLAELPKLELYVIAAKRKGQRDILLLAGDIQPSGEESCYSFCNAVLDIAQGFACAHVLTLGGIALQEPHAKPKLYITGARAKDVRAFAKGTNASTKLYGIVGPIMGVAGVMMALAAKRRIPAATLLAETYAHPLQLGVAGAREMLALLKKKLSLGVTTKDVQMHLDELEKELTHHAKDIIEFTQHKFTMDAVKETSYIG